ncbi:MAG: tryptophan synthase subunit alpha [Methanocalculus sp.]|uniref:tryptophan synthase subunit alpha n=1 Tax=Methanocalculus sp. TaxID=2004547 RepID=UPI00271C74C3|nr:tryptophan synthase subunit alpha [Methanocalculus sp.]MDO8842264.1 tryptophan synthase subunit alpha [Methanocalculus sp.]MDO9539975.1 tryptophan synthase subunit alpha [Methanocalculus sp.]
MTRIEAAFSKSDAPLLIACTVAGDPTYELSLEVVRAIIAAGADILELIIPNTNPVADGPVIRSAHERAIIAGGGVETAFALIRTIRRESQIPISLMTYVNPIIVRGEEQFFRDAADAGADGILVVDMPPEEGASLLRQKRIDPIFIIAPSTSPDRIRMIEALGRGFLYLVSAPGVTGRRTHLPDDLGVRVRRVKELSHLPVAVGFGIGSAETADEAVGAGADAVVVGSAITECILVNPVNPAPGVAEVIGTIRGGMRLN